MQIITIIIKHPFGNYSSERVFSMRKAASSALGAAIGIINGVFGAGAGAFCVFGLEKFLKLEDKRAHSTAIAVILPLTVVSAAVICFKTEIDWGMALKLSAGGIIGGFLGAKLFAKISSIWLNRIFGVIMIAAAVQMIFKVN